MTALTRHRPIPLILLIATLIAGCATRTGPNVTPIGTAAQRVTQVEQAATTAARAVDVLITNKVVTAQDADPVLLALRGVGQGGVALADALEALRVAKTPEAETRAQEIITKLQSSLYEAILAIPEQTKQKEVWTRVQPVFNALATVGLSLFTSLR